MEFAFHCQAPQGSKTRIVTNSTTYSPKISPRETSHIHTWRYQTAHNPTISTSCGRTAPPQTTQHSYLWHSAEFLSAIDSTNNLLSPLMLPTRTSQTSKDPSRTPGDCTIPSISNNRNANWEMHKQHQRPRHTHAVNNQETSMQPNTDFSTQHASPNQTFNRSITPASQQPKTCHCTFVANVPSACACLWQALRRNVEEFVLGHVWAPWLESKPLLL